MFHSEGKWNTITWKFAVERLASDLGISELTATSLDWDSARIDHVFPETKADYLRDLARQVDVPEHRTVAVGDSGGDVPMLLTAKHGIFVGQHDPELAGVVHMADAGIGEIAEHILKLEL